MLFEVFIHAKAKKKFERMDEALGHRIRGALRLLGEPFSLDTIKIRGEDHKYRTRIGKYRILFFIRGKNIYVVDFDARGKIYK